MTVGRLRRTSQHSNTNLKSTLAAIFAIAILIASPFLGSLVSASAQVATQYSLTVITKNSDGNELSGYYARIWQNGSSVATGFSPATFSLVSGQSYVVAVHDYGSYLFDHWQDTGSTVRERSISISLDTQVVAIYRNTNDPSPVPSPSPPPSNERSELSVNIQDFAGNPVNGFYTTLSQNGAIIKTGFTPTTFTLENGQTYQVAVQDYGQYAFDHWLDTGSKLRLRTISISSPASISAVYKNMNDPAPQPVPDPAPPAPSAYITKVKSGLVASDSLTGGNYNRQQLEANNPNQWFYYGSAVGQNAPVDYFADRTKGLYLGVQSIANGTWSGFFAETPVLDAQLYHAVLTIPYDSVSDNSFDTGLYVQTANGLINYVTCAAMATTSGSLWAVVRTSGTFVQATEFEVLWTDASPGQPKTRDCTIITNGDNRLQVYLDNKLVFSGSNLNLKMPPPFNAFLEVQSSSPTQMLFGTYKDYYATASQNLAIINGHVGEIVKVVRSGSTIATGTVGSDGKVNIDLGKYHFPLTASIQLHDSKNRLITSTKDVSLWGGDVYSLPTAGKGDSDKQNKDRDNKDKDNKHDKAKDNKDDKGKYNKDKDNKDDGAKAKNDKDEPKYNKNAGMHKLPSSLFEKKKK